ncbi:MAG: type II secretion system GspH family protein [Proteobacteria bacterium]|nr:type II secretion system GspH family protein [Pseudomonadota bacterium]
MKGRPGFTLIETVVALLIAGILTAFGGMLIFGLLTGYIQAAGHAELAMKAQVALDRLALELRDMDQISALTADTSITYVTDGVTRTIQFADSEIQLVTSETNALLGGVQTFSLSASYDNLDGVSGNETAYIDVGFTMAGSGANFSCRIFPRNLVPAP